MRVLLLLCLFCSFGVIAEPQPFFAPAEPQGEITVRLYPTIEVNSGTTRLVTFGVPMPRGSITPAALSQVRVLNADGQEVAAYVDALALWRHRSDVGIDGQSVRIVRIQIEHTFASTDPEFETVRVNWGQSARTQNRPALSDPRSAWHLVTGDGYIAGDNVHEPDVFAVLPAAHMVKGALRGARTLPLTAGIPESRDDPEANDATEHWNGFEEMDRALKNNFYSHINQDDPDVDPTRLNPWRTEFEPWLYDRAATFWGLYVRSGFFTAQRHALRASQFYANHVDAGGFFDLKPGDTKYAYNENLAYAYWLTADTTLLDEIERVTTAHQGTPHAWTSALNFWTERHAAYKLLANAVAYEVTGSATYRTRVNDIVAAYVAHQNGLPGIPAVRVDGGLYHLGFQHDYDWEENSYGASSWMSVLVLDAMVRAYGTGSDAPTAGFIHRMGTFLEASIRHTLEHSYDTFEEPLHSPRYGVLFDGSDGQVVYEDVEHALDVAAGLAWSHYFGALLGESSPQLLQAVENLYFTYDIGVNFWIRPSATYVRFRVSPWRKYGWEHRVAHSLPWAVSAVDDTIFADDFEAPARVSR